MNNVYRVLLVVLVILTSCGPAVAPVSQDSAALHPSVGSTPSPTQVVAETYKPASTPVIGSPEEAPATALPQPHASSLPSVVPSPRQPRTLPTPAPTAEDTIETSPFVIHVQNPDEQPGFVMSCPLNVVCDQHFDYRAYTYEDDRVFLYLSFDPDVIATSTYDGLIKHYNYLNMEVRFPERATATSRFYYANRYPVERLTKPNADGVIVEFFTYEESRLRGRISGTATHITEFRTSNEPSCRVGDQGGMCFFDEPAELPFVITFDLTLQHASGTPGV